MKRSKRRAKAQLEERTVELRHIATSISGTPHRWQELPPLQSCVRAANEVEAEEKLKNLVGLAEQVRPLCLLWMASTTNDAAVFR